MVERRIACLLEIFGRQFPLRRGFESLSLRDRLVELVDTLHLQCSAVRRTGSSPVSNISLKRVFIKLKHYEMNSHDAFLF